MIMSDSVTPLEIAGLLSLNHEGKNTVTDKDTDTDTDAHTHTHTHTHIHSLLVLCTASSY